jgi:hypothetical protein
MMVAIAAIALPIVLAVLGVIVSINPPSKKGHDRKIWIGVFILLGIFAVGIGIADRHNSDRAQNELKDSIDQLTKPIPPKAEVPARDPDTNGNAVGKVTGARITLNESRVYFEQIENAGNLDTNKPFEYRDYILRFVRADAYIGMLVSPRGVANNVYRNVVCEIIGRVQL